MKGVTMRWQFGAALSCAVLAGCGGGGGGGLLGGTGDGISVSTLSAAPLRYGRTTTVSVQGSGLDRGLALDADGKCKNVTLLPGGTDAQQNFTCVVDVLGELNMRVRDSGGRQLATLLLVVPQPQVTITTSKGTIVIEPDVANAKALVDNFLGYVGVYYVNTIFHRVDAGEAIYAGGFTNPTSGIPTPKANTTAAIDAPGDNGLRNVAGTVAMLRVSEGSTQVRSQFVINLKDNPQFDYVSDASPGRPVLGKVVSGLDVAIAIGEVPVNGFFNVPVPAVAMTGMAQTR
jgi:cyclophilin family peptidyl-prolyl cis-trans isomerase